MSPRSWAGCGRSAGDADGARSLLDHARGLYEDMGSSRGVLTVWTPYRIERRCWRETSRRATTLARQNFEALSALGELGYASTRAVELAELLLLARRRRRSGAAHGCRGTRWARVRRARAVSAPQPPCAAACAHVATSRSRSELAQDAVAIASLTDALRYRARAHLRSGRSARPGRRRRGAPGPRKPCAEGLLRQKGVKGALVGAPST